MSQSPSVIQDVEAWNDRYARTNDIDDYYTRASGLIRFVERRRLAWLGRVACVEAGQRLLEVGCGGGHVLRLFPEARRTGVDVSGVMLRKAERNLVGEEVRLLKGELNDLDLCDRGFDRIICTEVIEHVTHPHRLLAGMSRLLHPQGRLLITFPNDRLIHTIKSTLLRTGLTRLPGLSRISWGGDEFHLHTWRVGEMRALLSRYFTIVQTKFIPWRSVPIRCCFLCTPIVPTDSSNIRYCVSPYRVDSPDETVIRPLHNNRACSRGLL